VKRKKAKRKRNENDSQPISQLPGCKNAKTAPNKRLTGNIQRK
jgi:hypothetical protein